MLPAAASPLLALAVASAGTAQVGIRGETRAFSGRPADHGGLALDAYQLDPSIAVALEGVSGALRLSASYAPSLLFPSRTGGFGDAGPASAYHTGSAAAAWEDARRRIVLSAQGSSGQRVVTPLSQATSAGAAGGATPAASPEDRASLQPSAGVRAAPYAGAGVGLAAAESFTPRIRVGASAAWDGGGGRDEAARLVFPRQQGLRGEARAAWLAGPLDTLSLTGSASRIAFDAGRAAGLAGATARWEHVPAPGWTGYLEGGAAATATGPTVLYPVFEAGGALADGAADGTGAAGAARLPARAWQGRIRARVAPYVDAFSEAATLRVEAGGDVEWRGRGGFRVQASAARASNLSRGRWGPSVGVGQLGVHWRLGRSTEAGLLARAGWQSGALPGGAPWQWGLALELAWHGRTAL